MRKWLIRDGEWEISVVISCLLLPPREQNTPLKCFQLVPLMLSLTCFLSPRHFVHLLYSTCMYIYIHTKTLWRSRVENTSQINNDAFVTSTLAWCTYVVHCKKEMYFSILHCYKYNILLFSNDAVFQVTSSFLSILGRVSLLKHVKSSRIRIHTHC